MEKLDGLYLKDRVDENISLDDDEAKTKSPSTPVLTSCQLIASLKGFNVDNAIVREQIIGLIRTEVLAETQAREHQMIST